MDVDTDTVKEHNGQCQPEGSTSPCIKNPITARAHFAEENVAHKRGRKPALKSNSWFANVWPVVLFRKLAL